MIKLKLFRFIILRSDERLQRIYVLHVVQCRCSMNSEKARIIIDLLSIFV